LVAAVLGEDGFVEIGGGFVHYRMTRALDARSARLPPLVFLHEGLGSVALWRTFPDDVREALGCPTMLVYSRHGYGRSSVVREPRNPQYMHYEAQQVLPQLLAHFDLENPVLVGHSDGASIALIYGGSGFPTQRFVLMAPHVFVEECSLTGVRRAQALFAEGGLRDRMARHHQDADATFRGWSNAWLSPEFCRWNIEELLPNIFAPTLLIQGDDDEYGSKAQIDAIARTAGAPCQTLMLPGVGHAPHLESPDATRSAIVEFLGPMYA
jgi:pimeloyl-ACP methyl ester carboxylesterase